MTTIADRPESKPVETAPPPTPGAWPLERRVVALAGTMTLVSVLLAVAVSPWFLLLTAFVGINQWIYVIAGRCPASSIFERFGVSRTCQW